MNLKNYFKNHCKYIRNSLRNEWNLILVIFKDIQEIKSEKNYKVKLRQISLGPDCSGPIKVKFARNITVQQFIDDVLENHTEDWGEIGIEDGNYYSLGKPVIEYNHGTLKTDTFPEEILNKKVLKAYGHGGYTYVGYKLTIDEKQHK